MMTTVAGAGGSHVGKRRQSNEDSWLWLPSPAVAVVADGVGGHDGGEIASQMVVDRVRDFVTRGLSPEAACEAAHQALLAAYGASPARAPASTVLAVTFFEDSQLRCSWAGDCRLYRWRSGVLSLLSRDHSMVEELFRAGALTEEEARQHPRRNVVSRAVGMPGSAQLRLESEMWASQSGDRYLLCSDGLHGYLPAARIEGILAESTGPALAVETLIRAVLEETEAGDNLTAVCCFVSTGG